MRLRYCFLYVLFLVLCAEASAQSGSTLLHSLRQELFPGSPGWIGVNHVRGCEKQQLDMIYPIRKEQPDPGKILSILEQISQTKDTFLMVPLKDIYNEHLEFFKAEWEPVFHEKIYPCDFAWKQFQVLMGFEHVLHALYLASLELSPQALYDYYKEGKYRDYLYFVNKGQRAQIRARYRVFSEYVRKLRSPYWFAFEPDFGYLAPFLGDLESFFIDDLRSFSFNEQDSSEAYLRMEWFITHDTHNYYARLKTEDLDNVIREKFHHWLANHKVTKFYQIVGRRGGKQMVEYMADRLFRDEQVLAKYDRTGRDYLLRTLMINRHNRPYIRDYLMREAASSAPRDLDRREVLSPLGYFPERDVIVFLGKLYKSGRVPPEEKEIIEANLKKFHSNKWLSPEDEVLVSRLLRKAVRSDRRRND